MEAETGTVRAPLDARQDFVETLRAAGRRLLDRGQCAVEAGLLFAAADRIDEDGGRSFAIAGWPLPVESPGDAPVTKPAKQAKPGAPGAHPRHNYNAAGVCKCGNTKSASSGGRPRKQPAAPAVPDAEARTVPMPGVAAAPAAKPLGDKAADAYAAGGVGGAG